MRSLALMAVGAWLVSLGAGERATLRTGSAPTALSSRSRVVGAASQGPHAASPGLARLHELREVASRLDALDPLDFDSETRYWSEVAGCDAALETLEADIASEPEAALDALLDPRASLGAVSLSVICGHFEAAGRSGYIVPRLLDTLQGVSAPMRARSARILAVLVVEVQEPAASRALPALVALSQHDDEPQVRVAAFEALIRMRAAERIHS